MHLEIESKFVTVSDVRVHYLIAGKGEPILFIHGFPTSSYLWRNIMCEIEEKYQVIALDLPGYGKSDKRIDDSFSFRYYERVLTEFLNHLNIKQLTLGVHDLGGPIGLYWAIQNMERVRSLILFNTVVYPKFSWAVKLFAIATIVPGIRNLLTSRKGIKKALQIGVYDKSNLTGEIIRNYQSPFLQKNSRKVLLKSVQRLSMKGFKEIETKLQLFKGPVQIIYGENDKILPNVSATMERVKEDLPQSNITSIPNCGHFLQEDSPKEVSNAILRFMDNQ